MSPTLARLAATGAEPPNRRRLLLFAASAVAAVAVGFRLVTPAQAEPWIVHGGYYYIFAVFAAALIYGRRVLSARKAAWQPWLRRPGWDGAVLALGLAVAVGSDQFAHKVLFDEYVLQGTAWHLHATKEFGTPVRAYEFAGTWLTTDAFLDKRPFFFTFLVALVHDLTGFRLANAFAVNVGCAAVCLGLTLWLVRGLTGRAVAGRLAVLLLATLPLFGQNATGASMEMHNLAMIVVSLAAAVLYLRAPDNDRLALLVLTVVLLAQSRYESVIFAGPAAVVGLIGWARAGKILLPWPALIAPLLLVPYAWHNRYVDTKPVLWQLREGDTGRFGLHYLAGNLEGALNFFFAVSPGQPASLALTVAGLAGLGWALWRWARRSREPGGGWTRWTPEQGAVALFGAGIAANVALLLFYYWSRFDEPITARFALPGCFLLAIAGGWAIGRAADRWPAAPRYAAFALGAWVLVWGAPAYARRLYTVQNLVMHETDWELEQVMRRPGPVLAITSKATMPYLLQRIPAINTTMAGPRAAQIAWHLRQGTFREVLVAQVVRPTSARGEAGVEPDDILPPEFKLETIDRKRFGTRWIRVSRIVAIDVKPAEPGAPVSGGQ